MSGHAKNRAKGGSPGRETNRAERLVLERADWLQVSELGDPVLGARLTREPSSPKGAYHNVALG